MGAAGITCAVLVVFFFCATNGSSSTSSSGLVTGSVLGSQSPRDAQRDKLSKEAEFSSLCYCHPEQHS
jgi:hypothetical protein